MNSYTATAALSAALLSTLLACTGAHAQSGFPNRPIRLIVTQTAGSSNDVLARLIGPRMGEALGQPVVIDTRVGASGVIGTEIAAKSAPDGHTLLLLSPTVFVTLRAFGRRMPFDTDKHFIPLTAIARVSSVVTLHPSGPSSIAELLKLARAQPGRINYGSAGQGSPAHIASELINLLGGVRTTHVPYKGTAVAMTDLIAGQIQMVISSPLVVRPHVLSGRVKAIASTGAKRDPLWPELPAIAETLPGYDLAQWWGLAAIAGTPATIVARLHDAAVGAIHSTDIKERMTQQGATAIGNSPGEFAAFIQRERALVSDLVKRAGLALDD